MASNSTDTIDPMLSPPGKLPKQLLNAHSYRPNQKHSRYALFVTAVDHGNSIHQKAYLHRVAFSPTIILRLRSAILRKRLTQFSLG